MELRELSSLVSWHLISIRNSSLSKPTNLDHWKKLFDNALGACSFNILYGSIFILLGFFHRDDQQGISQGVYRFQPSYNIFHRLYRGLFRPQVACILVMHWGSHRGGYRDVESCLTCSSGPMLFRPQVPYSPSLHCLIAITLHQHRANNQYLPAPSSS